MSCGTDVSDGLTLSNACAKAVDVVSRMGERHTIEFHSPLSGCHLCRSLAKCLAVCALLLRQAFISIFQNGTVYTLG